MSPFDYVVDVGEIFHKVFYPSFGSGASADLAV